MQVQLTASSFNPSFPLPALLVAQRHLQALTDTMGAFVDDDALEVGDGGGGGRRKRGGTHAPPPEMSLQQALKKSWNGLVRASNGSQAHGQSSLQ
jgi:hypothetical protein